MKVSIQFATIVLLSFFLIFKLVLAMPVSARNIYSPPGIVKLIILNDDLTTSMCSGTLIGDLIITAAHCFRNKGKLIDVEVSGQIKVDIQGSIRVRSMNEKFDIALIRLRQSYSTPIRLPIDDAEASFLTLPGQVYQFHGYGLNETGMAGDLKGMQIKNFASSSLYRPDFVSNDQNSYALPGDSGGPLLAETRTDFILVGISTHSSDISIHSSGSGGSSRSSVFLKIQKVLPWINEQYQLLGERINQSKAREAEEQSNITQESLIDRCFKSMVDFLTKK